MGKREKGWSDEEREEEVREGSGRRREGRGGLGRGEDSRNRGGRSGVGGAWRAGVWGRLCYEQQATITPRGFAEGDGLSKGDKVIPLCQPDLISD